MKKTSPRPHNKTVRNAEALPAAEESRIPPISMIPMVILLPHFLPIQSAIYPKTNIPAMTPQI